MTDTKSRSGATVPWYLWLLGGVAVLWNGLGVVLWGGTSFMPATFLADTPPEQLEYVSGLPGWSTFAWGLGVLAGFVGSVLLLLRNRLAELVFVLSLVGAVANTMVYFTNPPPEEFFSLPLTLFIIGFACFILWFAHVMKRRGVLR